MARKTPFRRQVSDVVNLNQIRANNITLFLLREAGPVGFVVQEEGHSKKHKVCLGDPHVCSCSDFRKEKDLCKHICWILLKKFRLDKDDPLSWQLGLVERDIHDLVFGSNLNQSNSTSNETNSSANDHRDRNKNESELLNGQTVGMIEQRRIDPGDVCPICQDDLLNSHKPVTFCRNGCGNNIHIRCMSVWTEHKRKEMDLKAQDFIPCPICRGEFVQIQILMQEVQNCRDTRHPIRNKKQNNQPIVIRHHGYQCSNCGRDPIEGKLYKCIDCTASINNETHQNILCSNCFNDNSIHSNHKFEFRESSNGRWYQAPDTRGIPQGLIRGLENNDITEFDYNLLLQLDKSPQQPNSLKLNDLNRCPNWSITSQSRLLKPGYQCRLCLMSFKYTEHVRQLPQCQHIFHSHCIDPFLLHRSPYCPLDEIQVLRLTLGSRRHSTSNNLVTANKNAPAATTVDNQLSANHPLVSALSISSINSNNNRPNSTGISELSINASASNTRIMQQPNVTRKPRNLPPLPRKPTFQPSVARNQIYFDGLGITPLRPSSNQRSSNPHIGR